MYVYMQKISILKETTKKSSCSYSVLPIFHKRTFCTVSEHIKKFSLGPTVDKVTPICQALKCIMNIMLLILVPHIDRKNISIRPGF